MRSQHATFLTDFSSIGYCVFPMILPVLGLFYLVSPLSGLTAVVIYCFCVVPGVDHLFAKLGIYAPKNTSKVSHLALALNGMVFFTVSFLILKNSQNFLFTALGMGFIWGALGYPLWHEFLHHNPRSVLSSLFSILMLNPLFKFEHINVHHKFAGLKKDPATAIGGRGFYSYVFHYTVRSFKFALDNFAKEFVPLCLLTMIFFNFVFYYFGTLAAFVLLGQALVAYLTLCSSNYIQHYGESEESPVVWTSDYYFSNLISFQIPNHLGHHEDEERGIVFEKRSLPLSFSLCVVIPPIKGRLINS